MKLSTGVRRWCLEQCSSMDDQIRMMKSGVFRTHQRNDEGVREDTTEATIAEYERRIAKLDELLEKSAASKA